MGNKKGKKQRKKINKRNRKIKEELPLIDVVE